MKMLAEDFKQQGKIIERLYAIIDECIELFSIKAGKNDFHRICGVVLAKARNYSFGSYGLILDGLGQEAGALLRPFIEYHELLIYFRLDPKRIQQAIENSLPSAGKRAKLIKGYYHDLRKSLNENASHSSFSYQALNHLFDKPTMTIRKEQPMLPKVFFQNMRSLFIIMIPMATEAINCLQIADMGSAEKQAEAIEELKKEGYVVFKLNELQNTKATK